MSAPFGQSLSFESMISCLHDALERFPDQRSGQNTVYSLKDAGLGAFAVFFTQNPSFLSFQRTMEQSKGRSNAQSLFQLGNSPCDNHIRTLLDPVSPTYVFPVLQKIVGALHEDGQLTPFRCLDEQLLIALDGTRYFSSQRIHCEHCSRTEHQNGTITYSHAAITPVIVAPGEDKVITLEPEFITPQDGHDKQDCETAAAKRWLKQYGQHYGQWGATILGDDLYSRQPLCQAILAQGLNFLLVCKPDSHLTLYDWINGMKVHTQVIKRWTGQRHEIDTYRWVNEVPLRDGEDTLWVNWCELTTTDTAGNVLYKNAFITNHLIHSDNVIALVAAGRARWKVENENNNVLKTKGYHLAHNFGHGKEFLSSLLLTLNLLAFLYHTVLELLDNRYRLIRDALPRRQTFFDDLRALTRYMHFSGWSALLGFMIEGLELQPPDTG